MKTLIAGWLALAFATTVSAAPPDRLSPGDHSADVDGLRFHYHVAGHGPLLVVQAPGWGIGTDYLANGLAPLRAHFTVLTYDPRGTGGSTPVRANEHLGNVDLANDLERLRKYWGLSRMNLLGHSNGSAIAIVYAETHPAQVDKLVLVGSQLLGYTGDSGPAHDAEKARRKASPDFAWLLAHIGDKAPSDDQGFTAYFRERVGFYVYDPRKDAPTIVHQLTNTMSRSMNLAFDESPAADKAPPLSDLGKITAKTLVVEGRQDPVCPLAESEFLRDGIHGARLVAIDKSGHFPWVEQPDAFFAPVTSFLSE